MKSVIDVWRRELAITLRAPILYVIGGLFLVVQGIAFAGLVSALSDPRRPAPLGALLEGQLAGTLLTWVLQLVVLTLLGMRTIAEERRGGGWELLLTAQVSERAAVIGKWLAASTVYALLWLPTLAYLAVVAAFRSDGSGWDFGSIACGYLGAIALGAALLAWAVAASAATTTTLAAGAAGFAVLILWFLVGEVPSLWPDLATDHPAIASALSILSVRARLTMFARGEIEWLGVAFIAALAVTGLSLAVLFACVGRRRTKELELRGAATVLVAIIGVLVVVLAAKHPHSFDASAHRRNSLDPATVSVIAELPAPATLTIIQPTYGGLEPLYDEVAHVADRFSEVGRVTVRRVDPAALPGGLEAAARLAGLKQDALKSNGGVVVELAGRRRIVDVFELATIDLSAPSATAIEQLAIEQALAGTLAELATPTPITVCATSGHSEFSLSDPDPKAADWTAVGNRLRGDGMTTTTSDTFDACSVVVVAGPIHALTAEEALALQRFVGAGGGLLVAAATRPVPGGPELAPTGLEGLLAADGLALPIALAIDRSQTPRELPGSLLIASTYSGHPINAGFANKRFTLWIQPRVVGIASSDQALVTTTNAGWGETSFGAAPALDDRDLAGPVAIAAVGAHHRIVVVGSAESFTNAALAGDTSAADLWLEHAVRWLANRPVAAIDVKARTPDQVRLVMTASERRAVIALSVAGIPLAWLVIGGALVWWRRRRSAA